LKDEANLTNLNFLSDNQLTERLAGTAATPEQFAEMLRINTEARTRAIKIGFLVLSGLALLAIVPCSWLPDYKPGEIPSEPPNEAERLGRGQRPGTIDAAFRHGLSHGLVRRRHPR
jgi:hypothetical protein